MNQEDKDIEVDEDQLQMFEEGEEGEELELKDGEIEEEDNQNEEESTEEELDSETDGENEGESDKEGEGEESKEGELVVEIEGAEPEKEHDSAVIQKVRDANRDLKRQLKEERDRNKTPSQPLESLPAKPTLENCGWDEEVFTSAVEDWTAKKAEIDKRKADATRVEQEANAKVQAKINAYTEAAAIAKKSIPKLAEYEEAFNEEFDAMQRGIILQVSKNTVHMVAALGAYPKERQRLAALKDPVEFISEIVRLEDKLKTSSTSKKPTPNNPPEKRITGSGTKIIPQTQDKKLAALEAQSAISGDRTKVIRYKEEMKARQKQN